MTRRMRPAGRTHTGYDYFEPQEREQILEIASEYDLPVPLFSEDLLGCGLNGCVTRTNDPATAFKETSSRNEALFLAKQSTIRASGFVGVKKVFEVSRNQFFIWRDQLDTCCRPAVRIIAEKYDVDYSMIVKGMSELDDLVEINDEEEVVAFYERIGHIPGLRDVIYGLETFRDAGYGISDLHEQNVGIFESYAQLVYFDGFIERMDESDVMPEKYEIISVPA